MIGPGSAERLDFEALETCLRRRVLEFGAQLAAQRLNQDHSDRVGPRLACDCGGEARYAGRSAKTFETVLGPLKLERAYYHCQGCGHGFFPRDRQLGMDGTSLSPGVVRMTGSAAGRVSFAEASDLLGELAGVRVGAKQVERTAEALGREIAAAEGEAGGFKPEPAAAPTMYLGMDGTGVPVRKTETVGRAGKQPDGSSRTREVKLVLVWTAERLDRKTGFPERDAGSVSCSAAIESAASRDTDPEPSVFARRVRGEAKRRGFSLARRRVVLGDGAAWIWRVAEEEFPGAIQIVDQYHAREHLWTVSKALHGEDPDRVSAWAEARCAELEQGRLDELLDALRSAASCEEARRCCEYIERNRDRMRYRDFRASGLCIGSGVVEAGCKTVVGNRLKRAGMHWTVEGANAILALRCCMLSGRYEEFWEHRSTLGSKVISES